MSRFSGITVLDTPAQIEGYRLCVLRAALRLECKGLRHSRGSVCAKVKSQFGFSGNRKKVLDQLEAHIERFNQTHGFTKGDQ